MHKCPDLLSIGLSFILKCKNIIENKQITQDSIIHNLTLNLVEQQRVLEKSAGGNSVRFEEDREDLREDK